MSVWLIALLSLLPQEEKKPKGLAGVGLKPEQVNRAIDRGVEWYRTYYAEREMGGSENDYVAALAILHAGGHKKHADLNAKLQGLLKSADPRVLGTYELGVLAMICESAGDPQWLPLLQNCVQQLLEFQDGGGSWGYGGEGAPSAETTKREERRARLRVAGGKPLDGSVRKGDLLQRKSPWPNEGRCDNSASQYAVLGLYSGLRAGLAVDPEAWKRALRYYQEGQYEDGSWGYGPHEIGYGSMTCAGTASAAIAAYGLGDKEWNRQAAVTKGTAWLASHFAVDKNPPEGENWHYYYLYGVERVGRILDVEFLGDHEWYPLGARYLVDAQVEDGRWNSAGDGNEILSTGFALLFLTRATPSPMVAPLKRGGKGTLKTAACGAGSFYVVLDASGSMMAKIEGRAKFDVAKDAVCAMIESLPDGVKMGLRVYGHRKRGIDDGADEDTELLLPIGPLDRKATVDRIRKLRAMGKTPLTLSLQEAAKDLEPTGKETVTLVLLTDGAESTPNADPLKAARDLVKERPNVIVHVVAFDINDPTSRKQLEGIAKSGHGRCFPALKAKELSEALQQVFVTKTAYELADKDGKKVADGALGDERILPEGLYRFRCVVRGETFDEEIWINTDAVTAVTLDLSEFRPIDPEMEKRKLPQGDKKDDR